MIYGMSNRLKIGVLFVFLSMYVCSNVRVFNCHPARLLLVTPTRQSSAMRTLQARILPAIRALDRHCQGRRSFLWRDILIIMSDGLDWIGFRDCASHRIASHLQLSFNFPSAGLPYGVLRMYFVLSP